MDAAARALLPYWQAAPARYAVMVLLLLAGLGLARVALRAGPRRRQDAPSGAGGGAVVEVFAMGGAPGGRPVSDLKAIGAGVEEALCGPAEPDAVAALSRILAAAHGVGASDVHVSPDVHGAQVTFRVDGALYDVARIPQDALARLASRVKVAASLSIYARNTPQDGRLHIRFDDREGEVRVSILPTNHGEKIVMRLHHASQDQYDLERLGLHDELLHAMWGLLARTQGIVFLTGPTGSGKTTTIYSALRQIRATRGELTNIVTIEDPVEFDIPGVSQTQVDKASGLTFAGGLRSILRQDPDVIVVGEIRDTETAQIAIQAGLSGHLILTTLHAESAAGVFTRLINMDIEPFMLASATAAVLSQRLVRANCPHCRRPFAATPTQARVLARSGIDHAQVEFRRGAGCARCLDKGLLGRTGIYELLVVDDAFRQLVIRNVPTSNLHAHAVQSGMRTLLEDGLDKARTGEVPLDEVLRVAV